jgi:disulfide bond formation protein DsbB
MSSSFGVARLAGDSEALALCALALCGALVAGAQVMEHVFGYVPCPLCLMQRVWLLLAGLCAAAGLMHDPRWGIYPVLTAASAVAGGAFSIRQLWLQSLPPDQVPACGAPIDYQIQNFPLLDVLRAMTQGTGDCAKVDWSLLGLSFAGWALVGFVLVVALAIAQLRAGNRSTHV